MCSNYSGTRWFERRAGRVNLSGTAREEATPGAGKTRRDLERAWNRGSLSLFIGDGQSCTASVLAPAGGNGGNLVYVETCVPTIEILLERATKVKPKRNLVGFVLATRG